MGRLRKTEDDADRYLTRRSAVYYYKRRVPADVAPMDDRGGLINFSLKTRDLSRARRLRDEYERADNELWAMLIRGEGVPESLRKFRIATLKAKSLGFHYRTADEVALEPLELLVSRLEALTMDRGAINATLGGVERPQVKISEAFEVYLDQIAPAEVRGKSEGQRKRWKNGRKASAAAFIEVVGDLQIEKLSRDDTRRYYEHWLVRIAPKDGKPSHGPSIGNRRISDMRVFYREYFTLLGEPDRRNPFDNLSFKEKRGKKQRARPPFPHEWITDVILKSPALAKMNDEARGIMLVVADNGARPGEICNLSESQIVLDHPIPHIKIEPRDDPDDPREIKTDSSIRTLPLHGYALAVMRKFPKGFPTYRDNENSLSAAVNKFMRENGLLPTKKHCLYSFRHSFEDRMKNRHVDAELRRILFGHAIDREEYGEGGSLELHLRQIKKVSLPFDASIV
ncbi:integrase [Rhizobium bangladeshense]|uniref:DUF6538 domain-containing protein n=1 Tax=Rhizobium bangladeshense TaxID=1138189 RepID=UPI001A98C959|nr:DUF6538 domain-containing protein [Rhizobium bangladeshense]QSY95915.1 integrase [Rhizobium bangladeshense]